MSSQKNWEGQPLHNNFFLCKFKNLTTLSLPMLRARSNITFLELPTVDGLNVYSIYLYVFGKEKSVIYIRGRD